MSLFPRGRYDLSARRQELLQRLLRAEGLSSPGVQPITRRPENGPVPLSFAQQRLWFLYQLASGTPAYSIAQAVRYCLPIDPGLLELSLSEILRRHEVLRTVFPVIEGEPRQIVDPARRVAVPLVDLRALPAADREREAVRLATLEAHQPFDLTLGPVVRARLLQLDEADYVFLLHLHHIVADGWSMNILFHELAELYAASAAGRPPALPELAVQYADYSVWQRAWLAGPLMQQQLDYWRRQLARLPALELPLDHPRPGLAGHRGGHLETRIDHTVTRALKELCTHEGTTLFMVLLAAFGVLLARHSGQEDFAIGTPIAGRNRTEIETLIGFFVNMLVLRLDFSGEPAFRDLLARVRETALGAYAHQDLPFEKLVEHLQPERTLSRNPLFQVTFQLMPKQAGGSGLAGQSVRPLAVEKEVALFDLSLDVWEERGGLAARWEYNSDLFTGASIGRMSAHFARLLRGIVVSPDRPVWQLPLWPEADSRQVLVQWNATAVHFPERRSLAHLWEAQATATPDAPAVIGRDETWTYGELDRRAEQLACYLRELGVGPETLVGICLDRGSHAPLAVLGVIKAGGAYVPLDPGLPADRLAFMTDDLGLRIAITLSGLGVRLPQSLRLVCLDRDWPAIAGVRPGGALASPRAFDLAYILYTSGSSGQPKGVMVEHAALVNHAWAIAHSYGLKASDRALQFAPLAFDVAAEEMFPTWASGAALVLREPGPVPSIATLLREMDDRGVTVANLPTSYWHEWSEALEHGDLLWPGALRLVVIGSERILPGWFASWRRQAGTRLALINAYGATETTITSLLYHVPDDLADDPVGSGLPVGRPIANVEAYVLDRHGRPVPAGVPGELYIGGVGLGRGYVHRPDLTAERFVPHPFANQAGARLYRTGDLVRYLADGNVEFLGRVDDQVKVRGFRIELGEVEAILRLHPAVHEAVVVAREAAAGGTRLVAYLVWRPGADGDAMGLRRFLREHLPEYMLPSDFVALDRLPRTAAGKVDRRSLPPTSGPQPGAPGRRPPATELEARLAAVWGEILSLPQVGIDDNFFDLGGHSLLLVRVQSKLRAVLGLDPSMVDLFRYPTVSALARYLGGDRPAGESSLSRIRERAQKQRAALDRRR